MKKSKKIKRLLFVGLMLCSSAIFAEEWLTYFESDKFYFYLAPNSTQRAGDNIITHTIHDFKTPSERGERSRQITREYDCAHAQSRVLKMVTYSKEKAAGQIIRDEAETEPEVLSSEDWLAAVTLIAEVGEFLEKESS